MSSDHGGSWSPGSEAADHDPAAPRSLPHVDALDSLRAVAVVGVLVYHQSSRLAPGGWLGVSLFFTLSGFLITNLLLAERERSERIALGRFWMRRIRRLLPASLVALGLGAVVAFAETGTDVASFGADVRAAVLNVANWRFIASGAGYADAAADPSPVQHYWSLAIEEQFYVVLPLVVMLCLPRRRLLAGVVGATVVVSLFLQLRLGGGVDRIYFGTDTRAAELAVGVALAMAWPWVRTVASRSPWFADGIGLLSLGATAALFAVADLDARVVTSGALVAVTIVWVGLVVGAICGPRFGRVLGVPGLAPIGRISYGIYLYHWPVYLLLTPGRVGLDGGPLFAVRVVVTVAFAAVSARLLELPVRRAEWRPRSALAFAGVSIVAVAVASVLVPASQDEPPVLAGATLVTAPSVSSTTLVEPAVTVAPETAPTTVAPEPAVEPATAPPVPATTPPVAVPPRVPRLLVVGDSTVANPGVALQEYGAEAGIAEVQLLWSPGCAVVPYEVAVVRPGFEFVSPCGDVLSAATTFAIDNDIDAVVVMMGTLQLADARYAGLEGLHTVLDAAVESRYRRAMGASLDRLGAAGIPVLWADLPTPDWDIDQMGETQGIPVDGSGAATTNDPARAARLNRVDEEVIERYPLARRWGYTAILAGPDGVIDDDVRYDGVHVSRDLARSLVETSVFAELESVYRRIVGGSSASPAGGPPTTWDVPRS